MRQKMKECFSNTNHPNQFIFWFGLHAPAVSRLQGKSLIGPRLGLIHILQYFLNIFFTSVILK